MNKPKAIFQTSPSERFFYGFYFLGQLMFFAVMNNFLQLYMTEVGIAASVVGGIFIVAKIWDAINDPLFGIIVDKSNIKTGKYIPWVRLSSFLIPLATIFLFAVPLNVSVQIKVIWITLGYILWDTSYTICDVPIFALATSMTNKMDERNKLYLFSRFFTIVGNIVVVITVPLLFPKIGWLATILIISLFAMLTMLPIGYKAKERFFASEEKKPTIRELSRYLLKNKPLLVFNIAVIIASLTNTSAAVQSYFAIYCLGGSQWMTVLGLISALPTLAAVFIVQQVVKKVERRTVYLFCNAASYVLSIIMYFAGYANLPVLFSLIVLRTMLLGGSTVLLVMFTADCAEYGNFKTGERAQGIAFSIQTFSAKMTMAISSSISMFLLGHFGFVEGTGAMQSAETISGIWYMYSVLPAIAGFVSFLILLFGFKLYGKDVSLMMSCNAGEITKEEAEKGFSHPY